MVELEVSCRGHAKPKILTPNVNIFIIVEWIRNNMRFAINDLSMTTFKLKQIEHFWQMQQTRNIVSHMNLIQSLTKLVSFSTTVFTEKLMDLSSKANRKHKKSEEEWRTS